MSRILARATKAPLLTTRGGRVCDAALEDACAYLRAVDNMMVLHIHSEEILHNFVSRSSRVKLLLPRTGYPILCISRGVGTHSMRVVG